MAEYPELNLLMGRIYRYEEELFGKSGKYSEIDTLKNAITITFREIKANINERNDLRINKTKKATSKMIKLTSLIKDDINQVERMIKDFQNMMASKKEIDKSKTDQIFEGFNNMLNKLREAENDTVAFLKTDESKKFEKVDFSVLKSDSFESRNRGPGIK